MFITYCFRKLFDSETRKNSVVKYNQWSSKTIKKWAQKLGWSEKQTNKNEFCNDLRRINSLVAYCPPDHLQNCHPPRFHFRIARVIRCKWDYKQQPSADTSKLRACDPRWIEHWKEESRVINKTASFFFFIIICKFASQFYRCDKYLESNNNPSK